MTPRMKIKIILAVIDYIAYSKKKNYVADLEINHLQKNFTENQKSYFFRKLIKLYNYNDNRLGKIRKRLKNN